MPIRRSAPVATFLSIALLCCGGGTVILPVDGTPDASSMGDAGNMMDAAQEPALCTGDGIAFSATRIGGGPVESGVELHSRNGFLYVLLTGDCRLYCTEKDGVVHATSLTEQEALDFLSSFELSQFASRAGTYYGSACDQPSDYYALGSLRIDVEAGCNNGAERMPPWLQSMQRAFGANVAPSCATYPEWAGDVRYVLIDTEANFYPEHVFAHAVRWPLAIDPSRVAVRLGAYNPVRARRLAQEGDASTLRALRRRFLLGELAPQGVQFIPIEQADGHRYLLYVADAIPLEDEDGLLPFARR